MNQSRRQSLVESVVNILIGYCVAVLSQLLIFPTFNIHLRILDNLLLGVYFTVVSLIRSYCIRRYFTRRTH